MECNRGLFYGCQVTTVQAIITPTNGFRKKKKKNTNEKITTKKQRNENPKQFVSLTEPIYLSTRRATTTTPKQQHLKYRKDTLWGRIRNTNRKYNGIIVKREKCFCILYNYFCLVLGGI